jgi:predicted extracellular nuclease
MPNIVTLPGAPADIASSAAAYNLAQGMLVKFTPTTIVGPSSQPAFLPIGNLTPGSGFYGTTWVSMTESLAPNVVDYNPEVLLIGSKTADVPQVRTHDTLWSLTGVVDYDKGFLCIQPLADSIVLSHSSKPASPVSKRSNNSGTLRISTFDLGGVFDTFDTWSKNDPVVTPAVYATEITKMRKAIVEELLLPSILCVQNVENTGVLSDIAASVNANGGKYKIATARNYMGFSVDKPGSWDARGVINGFMYDTTFFSLDSIKLISGPSIDSAFGKFSPMPAADPLVGIFKIAGIQLPVVNVSLIDKSNDIPFLTTGWPFNEQSKQIRKMQAHAVRSWIDAKLASTPGAPMIIAGEFNDYPFAEPLDAADCPVSIVKGNAGKGETVFYNLYDFLPADSRYSCIVNGRAQMTEQLMIAPVLAPIVHGIDVLHFNAGFEDSFSADSSTAVRSSGHDPVEIRF